MTQNGRNQAARIGEFVASKIADGFVVDEHITTSPIRRAYQTAEIIAEYLPSATNGGRFGVETAAHVDRRVRAFISDNTEYLDASSDKIKLAIGHGALWGVTTTLVESRPIRSARIPKNYEVTLLSGRSVEIIDTRT